MIEWIVSSSALILLVLAVRALAKSRLSCRARYALWLLVLVRLLVPTQLFTASWGVSAVAPDSLTEKQFGREAVSTLELDTVGYDEHGNPLFITDADQKAWEDFSRLVPPETTASDSSMITSVMPDKASATWYAYHWSVADILRIVWLAGASALALVLLVSNLRFARRLRRTRVPYDALVGGMRVYVAEGLASPCLVGVFRPTVYLTPEATQDERTLRHVLAHETTHRLHGDCVWSLLRLAALCLHWYNPLVWLAVAVSKRDGELACDEATLARLGEDERFAYGETLLSMVTAKPRGRDLLSATTAMTAGKKPMRERIEIIAKHPRTKAVALLLTLAVLLTATVFAFSRAETAEAVPMTEEEALDALEASVEWENDSVSFTLPKAYEAVENWGLHIAGRAAYEDGMTMSVHFYEGEKWQAGERYTIESISNLTELTMQAALVGQRGGLYERGINLLPRHEWYFDLDGDGRSERLTIEESRLANSADASPVRLYDADGALIAELGDAGQSHVGWATYALVDLDGGTYLMSYEPTMFQGEALYRYRLLRLRGGRLEEQTSAQVQFSANPGAENDPAAMAEFQRRANDVWQRSRLLFTTDQEVLSHLYDADSGAAVETNGRYYIAPDGEIVRYRETIYGLLDEPAEEALHVTDFYEVDARRWGGDGWEPLSADELAAWDEILCLADEDGTFHERAFLINCFFTSNYSDPRDIDLAEFLAYCPLGETASDNYGTVTDEAERAALIATGKYPGEFVPVHRYRVADINAALMQYAGITLDDMDTDWRNDERMLYLPEYDAFYNFTSDAGFGVFAPESGARLGNVVTLYGEWSTLQVSGTPDSFRIMAFTER